MAEKPIQNSWKIVMLPRLQIDAIVAFFLLKYFGDERFPGIQDVQPIFWIDTPQDKTADELAGEGYILLDMGGGIFDHHATLGSEKEKCVSEIVAEYLGIDRNRSIKKLLEYARRDDLEGKGTLSTDPIDRAFGLSGLVNNLNRMLPDDQESVLATVMPLLLAHYIEEKKRAEDIPAEYKEKVGNGKAKQFIASTPRGNVKVVIIETDEIGMAGFLRARQEILADIVVQKMSSGHVNIITQQKKSFDLSEIARILRIMELQKKNTEVTAITAEHLADPGRVEGVEEWYFDARAKTIQNGGIRPQWTPATRLSLDLISQAIKKGAALKL